VFHHAEARGELCPDSIRARIAAAVSEAGAGYPEVLTRSIAAEGELRVEYEALVDEHREAMQREELAQLQQLGSLTLLQDVERQAVIERLKQLTSDPSVEIPAGDTSDVVFISQNKTPCEQLACEQLAQRLLARTRFSGTAGIASWIARGAGAPAASNAKPRNAQVSFTISRGPLPRLLERARARGRVTRPAAAPDAGACSLMHPSSTSAPVSGLCATVQPFIASATA